MNLIHEPHKIYSLDDKGKLLAEITFPFNSQGIYKINHTYVHPSLRKQGIAGQLMRAAINDIRKTGIKAHAVCPYAIYWFKKHPEETDILAGP